MDNVREPIGPADHYRYLSNQLRYLDDKIFRTLALWITFATAIVGGTFYLYFHTRQPDYTALTAPNKLNLEHLGSAANWIFSLGGIGSVFVISNNLRSWWDHRNLITRRFWNVPPSHGPLWWASEACTCIGIAAFVGAFLYFNPLHPSGWTFSVGAAAASLISGVMPWALQWWQQQNEPRSSPGGCAHLGLGVITVLLTAVIALATWQTAQYTAVQTRLETLLHRPTVIVDPPKIGTLGADSSYLSDIGALPAHNVTVQIRFFNSLGDRPKLLGTPIVSHIDHVDPKQELGMKLDQPPNQEGSGQILMEIAWDYFDSSEADAKVYRRYEFYLLEPRRWVALSLRGRLFNAHKEFFELRKKVFIATGALPELPNVT